MMRALSQSGRGSLNNSTFSARQLLPGGSTSTPDSLSDGSLGSTADGLSIGSGSTVLRQTRLGLRGALCCAWRLATWLAAWLAAWLRCACASVRRQMPTTVSPTWLGLGLG